MNKEQQKKLITEIMNDDAKDGLYISATKSNADMNIGVPQNMTAVKWLVKQVFGEHTSVWNDVIEQAKQMEKDQMVGFAEFVETHPDKNKNYLGEMLHAKSKYDGAERTIDLLEQYYNETYQNK